LLPIEIETIIYINF